jgi:hypothetical protein
MSKEPTSPSTNSGLTASKSQVAWTQFAAACQSNSDHASPSFLLFDRHFRFRTAHECLRNELLRCSCHGQSAGCHLPTSGLVLVISEPLKVEVVRHLKKSRPSLTLMIRWHCLFLIKLFCYLTSWRSITPWKLHPITCCYSSCDHVNFHDQIGFYFQEGSRANPLGLDCC